MVTVFDGYGAEIVPEPFHVLKVIPGLLGVGTLLCS